MEDKLDIVIIDLSKLDKIPPHLVERLWDTLNKIMYWSDEVVVVKKDETDSD